MSARPKLRLGWLVGGSVLAIAVSFATSLLVITGYATVLAVQARGSPDPAAISRFAAGGTVTWLSLLATALGAAVAGWVVARRTRPHQVANCLAVGVVLAVVLLLSSLGRGNPGLTALRAAEGLAICAGVGLLATRAAAP